MKTNQSQLLVDPPKTPTEIFILFEKIIRDRGSMYSVSGGLVQNKEDVKQFLKTLKKNKKYASATHNSWAVRIVRKGIIWETRSDDGETGAGDTILREMQKQNVINAVVCVTRWFGGVKLMGDRFRHLQDATRFFSEKMNLVHQNS